MVKLSRCRTMELEKTLALIPRCCGSGFGAECATIACRSWFFVRYDPPSDGDLTVDCDRASDEDWVLQKAPCVAHLASHLNMISHTCVDGRSRGLGSTRSMASAYIRRQPCRHVTYNIKIVCEHSPTRRKHWEKVSLNNGVR